MTPSIKIFTLILFLSAAVFAACEEYECPDGSIAQCQESGDTCTCEACPEEGIIIDGCGEVAPELQQECCSNWAYDNKIITPECIGYWEVSGNSCNWKCPGEGLPDFTIGVIDWGLDNYENPKEVHYKIEIKNIGTGASIAPEVADGISQLSQHVNNECQTKIIPPGGSCFHTGYGYASPVDTDELFVIEHDVVVLEITLDPRNLIEELKENNNFAEKEIVIRQGIPVPDTCEDYTCQDGKIAQCFGDENSCTCETCTAWEKDMDPLWRYAKINCYGREHIEEMLGGPTSCKSEDVWRKYADEACQSNCDDVGKCGLNAFSVSEPCKDDTYGYAVDATAEKEMPTTETSYGGGGSGKGFMCPPGMCEHKEKVTCVNQGTVAEVTGSIMYCSLDSIWQLTGDEGAPCLNNYECKSNFCSNAKCLNLEKELAEQKGLLEQILEFLARLFGLA